MKTLLKLGLMAMLLTLSVTSCTKTDLAETQATEGGDEKVKVPPSER